MEKLVRRLLKQTRNDGDPDSRICMVGFWIYFEDRALNTLCFFLKSTLFSWAGNTYWKDSIIAF